MVEDKQKIFLAIAVLVVAVLLGNQFGLFVIVENPLKSTAIGSGSWGSLNVLIEPGYANTYRVQTDRAWIGDNGDSDYQDLYKAWLDFDTSSVPDNAIINSVKLKTKNYLMGCSPRTTEYIRRLSQPGNTLKSNPSNFYTQSTDLAYVTLTGSSRVFGINGWNTVDLGSQAVADVKSKLSANWFSVMLDSSGGYCSSNPQYRVETPFYNPPTLIVDYVLCAGFTDLCDDTGADGLGVACTRVTQDLDCTIGGVAGKCSAGVCATTCSENQVVILNGVYNICHNQVYSPVTDLKLLTPAEQQAVLDQINELNGTIQEKAQIITSLNLTLQNQIAFIDELNATIQEKAQIINALTQNIQTQADIISGLQLTSQEQAQMIESLTLNINIQGELINDLTTNLAIKAALVDQLTSNNQEQAALIQAMELSFSEQAGIINQLNGTIQDDAQIISNLHLNLNDQATLINDLRLSNEELSQMVSNLTNNVDQQAALINSLNLKISDEEEVIRNLNLSLQQEQTLVNQLRRTVQEQQTIINNLQMEKAALIEDQSTFDIREIWDKYYLWIIGGGLTTVLALLFKKR